MNRDTWRTFGADHQRPPPCDRCGLVEAAYGYQTKRHTCNPTHVQLQQIGQPAVEAIGRSITLAFRALTLPPETP